MILSEAEVGRKVKYTWGGSKVIEFGIITSYNKHFVFVQYEGDRYSKGTPASYLEYVEEE